MLSTPVVVESTTRNDRAGQKISIKIKDTVAHLEKAANEKISSILQSYGCNVNVVKVNSNGEGIEESNGYKWSNNLDAYEAQLKRENNYNSRKLYKNSNIYFRCF